MGPDEVRAYRRPARSSSKSGQNAAAPRLWLVDAPPRPAVMTALWRRLPRFRGSVPARATAGAGMRPWRPIECYGSSRTQRRRLRGRERQAGSGSSSSGAPPLMGQSPYPVSPGRRRQWPAALGSQIYTPMAIARPGHAGARYSLDGHLRGLLCSRSRGVSRAPFHRRDASCADGDADAGGHADRAQPLGWPGVSFTSARCSHCCWNARCSVPSAPGSAPSWRLVPRP
jgi:hypothetical protein